jgi:hypothetical protein
MGVVRITENLGEGRYRVSIEKNVERAKALRALLEKQIEKLKAEIKELKKKLPELENKIDDKRIELVLARQKFIDDTDNVAFLETQLNTLNQTIEQLEKRLKSEKETKATVDKLIDSGNISTNTTLGGSPIINDLGCSLSATRRATKANIKDKLTPTAEGPPVGELVANGKGRKGAALAFNFREITTAEILATRQATKGKFKEYNISPGVSTEIGLEAYSRRTKMVAKGEVFPAQPKISKKEFLAGDLTTVRPQIKGVFKTEKLFTEEPTEGELKAYRKGMKPLVTIINAGINIDGKVEATRKATKGKFKDAAPPEAARPSSEILATRKGTDATITCELVLKTQPQAKNYFQAVSDSKQDVIDGLNQRLNELTQEKNEILNQIKDLRDPTDLIKEYEQILAEMSEVVLKKQGLDNDIRKSEITLDKKEKLQRDYNETITQPDNRPAWCVDYAVDLDSSTEAIENRLTEIQNNINALLQDNINLTTEINAHIAGGIPEDADIIKQAKAAIKGNLETIDSLKAQKKVVENGLLKVSVDINDENELILIGPYTYEPIEKDAEEKEDYIAGKLEEKDKLDLDDNILFNVITSKQTEVDIKYAEINGLSLQIAAIDVSNNPQEQAKRRLILQEKIDKLREEIHRLSKDIIKIKREKEKNRAKAAALAKVILRLNSELEQINNALESTDKILLPQVNDKTRRFQPTQSSSPEAVFFNKSLLPGFQKWKPTFRLGVIKAMQANDLCTVELEEARSSQQNLNINRHRTLYDVRIKYGSCNSGAFDVGDRVVVEFSEREQDRPTVIGFEDNPKPCGGALTFANSDGELGAYPNSSDYGLIGSPPYQKWLSCNLVNRFSHYPNPREVNNYYAGRQYWFDGEVSAISWHEKTLYIRGRFYTFPDENTTILAAAFWEMPDPANTEATIKVLIVLTLFKTALSRETNLRFLTYSNNPTQPDALNITELRKLSLPEKHKVHFVLQGYFSNDGSIYVYCYEEQNIQYIKKLTFTYGGEVESEELFTLPRQKVGAPTYSGTGSDVQTPPPPANPDPSAYIGWTSSSSTTANYNTISQGGDLIHFIVTNEKVFYFYLKIESYSHSVTTSVNKTGFYRTTTPAELTINTNESNDSTTTGTYRMGVFNLVTGAHDANAWIIDTEGGSGSGTSGSSSVKTYFPENKPNGQYTGETVIYSEDYITNKVLYIFLGYDSVNDVLLFVKINVDYELSSTSTHAYDYDGNETIVGGSSDDTVSTTYEFILNRKKGGGVIDNYIDNANMIRDISSPMNIFHGGIGYNASNAYVLGAYFRLATGLSKLYGVNLLDDSEPAYIKTWNLDGDIIRAQDIYPVIT